MDAQLQRIAGISVWEEDFSRVKSWIATLRAQGINDFSAYFATHPDEVVQAIGWVRLLDVNDWTLTLFGAGSKTELLVSLDRIFLPETHAIFVDELLAIAEGSPVFTSETVLRTLNGERLNVVFTINFPSSENFDRVIVVLTDITAHKRAEERTQLLQSLTVAVSNAVTATEAADFIVMGVSEALNCSAISIYQLSDDRRQLSLIAHRGLAMEAVRNYSQLPMTTPGPLVEAVQTLQPIWLENADEIFARYPSLRRIYELNGTQASAVVPFRVNSSIRGGMTLSFPQPTLFPDENRAFLLAIVQQCGQALERARLYHEVKEAAARATILHNITAALAAALTLDQVATAIIDHALDPLRALSGVVALMREDLAALQIVSTHNLPASPDPITLLVPMDRHTVMTDAAREGAPIWLHDADELRQRYPETYISLASLGTQAGVGLPLFAGGRLIGALGISFSEPQTFDTEQRSLIYGLAQQCAQALDRALLYDAERSARAHAEATRQRIERLQIVTEALVNTITQSQVAKVIVRETVDALDASTGVLMLLNGSTLEVSAAQGVPDSLLRQWQYLPVNTPNVMVAAAVRSRAAIWIESPDDPLVGEYRTRQSLPTLDHCAWIVTPLLLEQRVLGTLSLSFENAQVFTPDLREFVITLARQCAQALERARLYEQAQQNAALEERQRLARELHDAVSQTLFSATIMAESVPLLLGRNPAKATEQAHQVVRLNRAAMAEMRTLLLELRPDAILRTAYPKLLDQLLETVKGRKDIDADLTIEGDGGALAPEVHLALYRIAQESLTNVVKHSGATRLSVKLRLQPQQVHLEIRDNGRGFDLRQTASGLGLNTMQERAAAVGASLQIDSQPGQGTRILLRWG